MARKRMFDNDIINQDIFIELPIDAKALYFLLGMEADDEGFVSPKKILRIHGISEDSLKILIMKRFLILFESGVIVITDWKRNNYLDKNKIKETIYLDEKNLLSFDEEKQKYALNADIPMVKQKLNQSLTKVEQKLTQNRVEEYRVEEYSIDNISSSEIEISTDDTAKANRTACEVKHKYGEYKHVLLKDKELQALQRDYNNWEELIRYLDEYIEMKGTKYKSHYLAIRKWVVDAVKRNNYKNNNIPDWVGNM